MLHNIDRLFLWCKKLAVGSELGPGIIQSANTLNIGWDCNSLRSLVVIQNITAYSTKP